MSSLFQIQVEPTNHTIPTLCPLTLRLQIPPFRQNPVAMPKFVKWFRKAERCGKTPRPEIPVIVHCPRAMHQMEWDDRRRPINPNRPHIMFSGRSAQQNILVVIQNAHGATDGQGLITLLEKETGEDIVRMCNPTTEDWLPTYFCAGYPYQLIFVEASSDYTALRDRYIRDADHFGLFLNYDTSSTESWDEMIASYEDISSRFEDGVNPFPTVMAAMCEGSVSHEEAERSARQRSCRFFYYSPVTGRGLCTAFASIVERAHATRLRYATDPDGFQAAVKTTAEVVQSLFPSALW
ncbi:hypothetical protein N657DRAFT_649009 [Parathielavia appendiculata]|uniref:Uncharacterized protein n=1 Tax=Parathielavia appendiculata TaxID=2587402 RepID=A0AAN6TV29_9PEZI|nr:hypothetical protein N657DRAFT_649009 [Parathielavia appendiculata]